MHLDCEPLAIVQLWLQIGRASASQDHFRSPRLSCGLHNARVLPRVPGVIVGKTGEACVAMVAEAWEEVLEEPRSSARISGKELWTLTWLEELLDDSLSAMLWLSDQGSSLSAKETLVKTLPAKALICGLR